MHCTFTISVLAQVITIMLNPVTIDMQQFAWIDSKVSNNTVDCSPYPGLGTYCVSNFPLAGTTYVFMMPEYASLAIVNIDIKSGIFMTYNYTGPDWILKVGVELE